MRTDNEAIMADPRIIDIELDERTIIRRERGYRAGAARSRSSICSAGNSFAPAAGQGSRIRVLLRVEDNRLAIDLKGERPAARDDAARAGALPAADQGLFRDLRKLFQSGRNPSWPQGLETIDMARRAIHNGGAELLQECLDDKVEMDFDTARRLFTLICVLHIR